MPIVNFTIKEKVMCGMDAYMSSPSDLILSSIKDKRPSLFKDITNQAEQDVKEFENTLVKELSGLARVDIKPIDLDSKYLPAYQGEIMIDDEANIDKVMKQVFTIVENIDKDSFISSKLCDVRLPVNGQFDEYQTKVGLAFETESGLD